MMGNRTSDQKGMALMVARRPLLSPFLSFMTRVKQRLFSSNGTIEYAALSELEVDVK